MNPEEWHNKSKWDKLNAELDDCLSLMTSEDWNLWASKRVKQTTRKMKKPIEKAEELVFKFALKGAETEKIAIECALIVVDEIINTDMLIDEDIYVETPSYLEYWKQVEEELTKKLELTKKHEQ
jgi:hypothetical protein